MSQTAGQFNGADVGLRESPDVRAYHPEGRNTVIPAHHLIGADTWRDRQPVVIMDGHVPQFELDLASFTKDEILAARASTEEIADPSERTYATMEALHAMRQKQAQAHARATQPAPSAAPVYQAHALPAPPVPMPSAQPMPRAPLPQPSQLFPTVQGPPPRVSAPAMRMVTFSMEGFGDITSEYLDVIRKDHLLVLVRQAGKPGFTPTTKGQMVVYPEGDDHVYGVEAPQIEFDHGGLNFCVLFVANSAPYSP